MADRVLAGLLYACALLAGAVVLVILVFLLIESWPALLSIGPARFFSDASWHPASDLYNLLPMVWGTLFAAAGAVLIAAPMGLFAATFLQFYAPRAMARPFRRVLELMAGVPSVVYGFWGLVVLVPLIRDISAPGTSLLAAILVLTLMVLPTMALAADAALAALPRQQLQAAAALGLSRASTVLHVAFPAARAGILTGGLLQAGRAVGETMAVMMVAGNVVQTPDSLFEPVRTLTANIALEMAYATGDHRAALFVAGLILFAVSVALVLAAERVSGAAKEPTHA
ncbi:phosphate ABC transporter permease subunit PstC [Algiphilus sp.]|uniref:phosphate ABC transporter permease subunit PstC n=1 Tax=Algiphilus sp. TaxID=1872431 RepID=UPI003B523EF5